jgi:aspartate-semialdehyde dehydrogenase
LAKASGVRVVDDPGKNLFPMPKDASGELDVLVGRIRAVAGEDRSLAFFVSGDQLLKGAAWNAVQIAEELAKLGGLPG